jgi:hypothetical protein
MTPRVAVCVLSLCCAGCVGGPRAGTCGLRNRAARRLLVRFPPDEPWPAAIATAAAAVFASAAAVIVGRLGSMIVEMVQLGDTHLSYRAGRLPWQPHWLSLFLGGVMVFCFIALVVRWRERPGAVDR